jgi:hypothetical protein
MSPEHAAGPALLPIFALATVIATIAIAAVVAYPTTFGVVAALTVVIGFGCVIVAVLGRIIGPDED